jgi:phosphate/sulfate permease
MGLIMLTLIGTVPTAYALNRSTAGDIPTLGTYKKALDGATKFIPLRVRVAVAIALTVRNLLMAWVLTLPVANSAVRRTLLHFPQPVLTAGLSGRAS